MRLVPGSIYTLSANSRQQRRWGACLSAWYIPGERYTTFRMQLICQKRKHSVYMHHQATIKDAAAYTEPGSVTEQANNIIHPCNANRPLPTVDGAFAGEKTYLSLRLLVADLTMCRTPGRAPDGREAQRHAALTRPNWALATLGGGYGGRRSVPVTPDVTARPLRLLVSPGTLRAGSCALLCVH